MNQEADIGTMLVVAGLFAISFYLLRGHLGPESAVVAAAVPCAGLTGATLAACKKVQAAKPKPKPITPAPKQKVIATRFNNLNRPVRPPTRTITPANPITICIRRGRVWQNGRCIAKIQAGIKPNSAAYKAFVENKIRKNCRARARALYLPRWQQEQLNFAKSRGYKTLAEFFNDPDRTTSSSSYGMNYINNKYEALITKHSQSCIRAAGYPARNPDSDNRISNSDPKNSALPGMPGYAV